MLQASRASKQRLWLNLTLVLKFYTILKFLTKRILPSNKYKPVEQVTMSVEGIGEAVLCSIVLLTFCFVQTRTMSRGGSWSSARGRDTRLSRSRASECSDLPLAGLTLDQREDLRSTATESPETASRSSHFITSKPFECHVNGFRLSFKMSCI